jgi:ribosomal-protein-serine acetyltransferase
MPWPEHTRGVDDQRAWIAQHLEDTEGLGIDLDGRLVGGAGLTVGPFAITAEIGYWIDGAYEGRGLVTGAVIALIELGFRHVGVHRIAIRAGVDNVRSRAIPERLGFTLEGVLRGEGKGSAGHGFHDLALYSMLEDEWQPPA